MPTFSTPLILAIDLPLSFNASSNAAEAPLLPLDFETLEETPPADTPVEWSMDAGDKPKTIVPIVEEAREVKVANMGPSRIYVTVYSWLGLIVEQDSISKKQATTNMDVPKGGDVVVELLSDAQGANGNVVVR